MRKDDLYKALYFNNLIREDIRSDLAEFKKILIAIQQVKARIISSLLHKGIIPCRFSIIKNVAGDVIEKRITWIPPELSPLLPPLHPGDSAKLLPIYSKYGWIQTQKIHVPKSFISYSLDFRPNPLSIGDESILSSILREYVYKVHKYPSIRALMESCRVIGVVIPPNRILKWLSETIQANTVKGVFIQQRRLIGSKAKVISNRTEVEKLRSDPKFIVLALPEDQLQTSEKRWKDGDFGKEAWSHEEIAIAKTCNTLTGSCGVGCCSHSLGHVLGRGSLSVKNKII
ncbi:hypothetical protein ADUPG1_000420 [Aduncisulcus paluster]|uniref:Uncharacterized protein n=1 Tax=Aduncisulcus paluster TaxID=2918883 RepID=A0ABQ5K6C6_9EUKA|nr:hypothetical protein ADUPG1_000420 [Aduncisulcus paluster]